MSGDFKKYVKWLIASYKVIWDEHTLIKKRSMIPKAISGWGNLNS